MDLDAFDLIAWAGIILTFRGAIALAILWTGE